MIRKLNDAEKAIISPELEELRRIRLEYFKQEARVRRLVGGLVSQDASFDMDNLVVEVLDREEGVSPVDLPAGEGD